MKTVLGRTRYHCKKCIHAGSRGGHSGDTSILYVPVSVKKQLGLKDKDVVEFCLTDDMHIEIRKALEF